MCWWRDYDIYTKDIDSLRNLFAIIANQYKSVTGKELCIIKNAHIADMRNCIHNDEKPHIVAPISFILGSKLDNMYPHMTETVCLIEKYKYTLTDHILCADQIIDICEYLAKKNTKTDHSIPDNKKSMIIKYMGALTSAFSKYAYKGENIPFCSSMVLKELEACSK